MPVTVSINGLTAVHQGSNGIATATVPDVCLTPGPSGPVPVPYPNIAMSSDLVAGTTSITIDGSPAAIQSSKFVKSTGDEAGAAGGVVSGVFAMEATFISFSPTVMLDGKPACRLTDKMLMNKGNTVCMGGEMQSPPVSAADPASSDSNQSESPDAPKQCVLRSVLVKCGHDSRGLVIDLSKGDVQVLKVISKATEPDKLTVEWDGNCEYGHSSYCPGIFVIDDGNGTLINRGAGNVEMPAPYFSFTNDPIAALKALLLHAEIPHGYRTINGQLCQGDATADQGASQWVQVQIYPELAIKADMTLGYSKKEAKGADGKEQPLVYDEKTTWKIGGGIEATVGASKLKFDASASMESLPMFGPLLKNVGWLSTVLDSMSSYGLDVKIEPKWPLWKLTGADLKMIELKGKPGLGVEGKFAFGFEPLFGIELSASILDWLMRFLGDLAGPPGAVLAEALVQVRKRFAKGVSSPDGGAEASLDIDIVATVSGEVKGGFAVKFEEDKSEVDDEETGIEGSVGFSVTGKVIGKGRIWKVSVAGGGQVGSSSADSIKEPSKIVGTVKPDKASKKPFATTGQLKFTGLAFYYLLYVEVGVGGGDSHKTEKTEEKTDELAPDTEASTSSKTTLVEKKGTAVLLHPWTWPSHAAGGLE